MQGKFAMWWRLTATALAVAGLLWTVLVPTSTVTVRLDLPPGSDVPPTAEEVADGFRWFGYAFSAGLCALIFWGGWAAARRVVRKHGKRAG